MLVQINTCQESRIDITTAQEFLFQKKKRRKYNSLRRTFMCWYTTFVSVEYITIEAILVSICPLRKSRLNVFDNCIQHDAYTCTGGYKDTRLDQTLKQGQDEKF